MFRAMYPSWKFLQPLTVLCVSYVPAARIESSLGRAALGLILLFALRSTYAHKGRALIPDTGNRGRG